MNSWIINNQYLVVGKLGIGGFATVYKAWDRMLQKFVAIKKIHDEFANNAKYVDMFRKEAINAAKLEHENIVRVVNFIKDDQGNFYIIMDYVKGVDLEYLIKKCIELSIRIPPDTALYIIAEIIKALDFAHSVRDEITGESLNMIHQDISPGNIMLYFDGRIKLTDFGIARAGGQSLQEEQQGKLRGKIAYMSPEQAQGQILDGRSDLFSCGVVLYEMLTGERLFTGERDTDIWQKVKSADTDLKQLKELNVPEEIQQIIKRSLCKSPDKRYQNATEMFIEIKRYLSGIGRTEDLKNSHSGFIRELLEDEIRNMERELEQAKKQNFSYSEEETAVPSPQVTPSAEEPEPAEPEEEKSGKEPVPADTAEKEEKKVPEEVQPDVSKGTEPNTAHDSGETAEKEIPEAEPEEAGPPVTGEEPVPEATPVEEAGSGKEPEPVSEEKMPEIEIPSDEAETASAEEEPAGSVKKEEESANEEEAPKKESAEKTTPASAVQEKPEEKKEPVKKAPSVPVRPAPAESSGKEKGKESTSTPGQEKKKAPVKPLNVPASEESVKQKKSPEMTIPAPDVKPEVKKTAVSDDFEEKSSDKEKTVFDFVLDTAKKYKKIFISVLISVVLASAGFIVVDTYVQLTMIGTKIHNIIWPPALQLDSIPTGARIELLKDGVDIISKEGYRDTTPSFIEKIPPGVYTLKMEKQDLGEVVRSVTVFGKQEGLQSIAVAGASMVNGIFKVPFEVAVEIRSNPQGALLYIDGKKIGETPFEGAVEVGIHNFHLVKEGFEILGNNSLEAGYAPEEVEYKLGVCLLDTLKPADQQNKIDFRFWNVTETKTPKGGKKFLITGTLWKKFDILSTPDKSSVFAENSDAPIGVTPLRGVILTAGKHKVKISRKGYLPWTGTVDVEPDSIQSLEAVLKKEISIRSHRRGGSPSRDINAYVEIPGTSYKGKTPLNVVLPYGKYTFKFSKYPSYIPASVTRHIGDIQKTLNAALKLRPPHLKVYVVEYATGKKIRNATVWVNGSYWKRADGNGVASDYITQAEGELNIEVKAEGYDDYSTVMNIARGQRKKLKIVLGVPKDGKLILDIPKELYGTSVYLDSKYIGEDPEVIENISRSKHVVEFKINNIQKSVKETIDIDEKNRVVILQPVVEKGKVTVKVFRPPFIDIQVKDFGSGNNVEGASIFINGFFWKKTGKNGSAAGYLPESEGEYKVEVKTEEQSYEPYKTVAFLERNDRKELSVRLGAPKDGTIVLDIPEEIYDASIYLDGEHMGENLPLISNVSRGTHVVEIQSELFDKRVYKTVTLSKPDQLLMLKLINDEKGAYLEELDPETYWQQYK